MVWLGVAVGGGIGAVLRYLVDRQLSRDNQWPWGLYLVNISGSFALGLVAGLAGEGWIVLTVGLLGGYTTFSTAAVHNARMLREKHWLSALAAGPGMMCACLMAAWLGISFGL